MNNHAQIMTYFVIVLIVGLIYAGLQTNMNSIIQNQIERNKIIVDSIEETGLVSDMYYQHYYNGDGKLLYSCISEIRLTQDECKAQQNMNSESGN